SSISSNSGTSSSESASSCCFFISSYASFTSSSEGSRSPDSSSRSLSTLTCVSICSMNSSSSIPCSSRASTSSSLDSIPFCSTTLSIVSSISSSEMSETRSFASCISNSCPTSPSSVCSFYSSCSISSIFFPHICACIVICWNCCWYVAPKSSFVTSPSFTSATISGIPSNSGSGISGCSSFALSSLLSSPHAASTPIINTRDNINNHFFRNINTPFLIMWCHSNTILCVVKNYIPHYILL